MSSSIYYKCRYPFDLQQEILIPFRAPPGIGSPEQGTDSQEVQAAKKEKLIQEEALCKLQHNPSPHAADATS